MPLWAWVSDVRILRPESGCPVTADGFEPGISGRLRPDWVAGNAGIGSELTVSERRACLYSQVGQEWGGLQKQSDVKHVRFKMRIRSSSNRPGLGAFENRPNVVYGVK
jgi:hypothetical protein